MQSIFIKNRRNHTNLTTTWEQRELKELASFAKGSGYAKTDIKEQGTPLILYGRLYTKYETKIDEVDTFAEPKKGSVYSKGTEVVVPASGESADDIARASFVAKSGILLGGDLNIIYPNEMIKPTFLALSISNGEQQKSLAKKAQGKSVVHLHNSDLETVNIVYPTIAEQTKIGRYFLDLDNLITLHQRKYSLLFIRTFEILKEACFFLNVNAWEQREFGKMFKRRMERNNGQFDNTRWISVAKMYFQEPDKVTSNNIDTRTYVMRRGDIAFEGHSNAEYKYGRFVANDIGDGVISELFPIYMHIDDYDESYWKYAIQIEEIMAPKLLKCIEISYTSSNKLDEDFFLKESVLVPNIAEQEAIGSYFRNLDHLITLHQRKPFQRKNGGKNYVRRC